MAIKSAILFRCGRSGVRSSSGWHYAVHVKSEIRLRQSWRSNHKAISHPSKSSSEPYSSTVNFNWKSKLLCSRYSLQFLLRYTTLQINFKWFDCSGAPHYIRPDYFHIIFHFSLSFLHSTRNCLHLYFLMPINLILLLSFEKRRRRNLIYVLVYVEHSFFLVPFLEFLQTTVVWPVGVKGN